MSSVVVVGLGYVGVPLAQLAVARGLRVTGLDTSERAVAGLNAGVSHIDDLSDADVAAMVAGGFSATTDPATVSAAETVVICVPTPLDPAGGPDLSMVRAAATSIAPHLRAGTLVVLESTTYPGTTEEVLGPILQAGSGLRVGTDLSLAFSPERVDPGNPDFGIANTPKVVGGVTEECARRAAEFYGQLAETVVVARGTREAEMSKLLENTYRQVNIALVNEMARFSHELSIDFWDVIRLARTKPFGFQAFYPGPGVGGHCIPIDPNYLSHRVQEQLGYPFRFVELAQEINSGMPRYVAQRIQTLLNDRSLPVNGSKILLLGVTYKPDIADQRESPAIPLARLLLSMGAQVSYADPHVPDWLVEGTTRAADAAAAAADADITVLLQQHRAFDLEAISAQARCLFDLRHSRRQRRATLGRRVGSAGLVVGRLGGGQSRPGGAAARAGTGDNGETSLDLAERVAHAHRADVVGLSALGELAHAALQIVAEPRRVLGLRLHLTGQAADGAHGPREQERGGHEQEQRRSGLDVTRPELAQRDAQGKPDRHEDQEQREAVAERRPSAVPFPRGRGSRRMSDPAIGADLERRGRGRGGLTLRASGVPGALLRLGRELQLGPQEVGVRGERIVGVGRASGPRRGGCLRRRRGRGCSRVGGGPPGHRKITEAATSDNAQRGELGTVEGGELPGDPERQPAAGARRDVVDDGVDDRVTDWPVDHHHTGRAELLQLLPEPPQFGDHEVFEDRAEGGQRCRWIGRHEQRSSRDGGDGRVRR